MSEEQTSPATDPADAPGDPKQRALPLVQSMLEACSSHVGPALGVELEVGECEVDVETEQPEGELAVLPLRVLSGGEPRATIEIVSPLPDIVALARRMNGADDPEAKQELAKDDLEAIAELLRLMGGAVEEALRAKLDATLSIEAGEWWRSDQAKGACFATGASFLVGAGALSISAGSQCSVFLRLDAALFAQPGRDRKPSAPDLVLLLALGDALRDALTQALSSSGMQVVTAMTEDAEVEDACARANAIFVSSEREDHLALCRSLRVSDKTWRAPIVLCVAEPTRELVVAALGNGASHVLRVPAEPAEVLRVLAAARPRR